MVQTVWNGSERGGKLGIAVLMQEGEAGKVLGAHEPGRSSVKFQPPYTFTLPARLPRKWNLLFGDGKTRARHTDLTFSDKNKVEIGCSRATGLMFWGRRKIQR